MPKRLIPVIVTATTTNQTQYTFDNTRITLTASQSDATTPATGESDFGNNCQESATAATTNVFEMSADSGTNFTPFVAVRGRTDADTLGDNFAVNGIGNSTGRYRYVMSGSAGTRIYNQMTTTIAEET